MTRRQGWTHGGRMRARPYSAMILGVCGVILIGMGFYFLLLRPPFLPEDARYVRISRAELDTAVPGLALWLRRVFWVLGGYIVATGLLTLHIATTSFRARSQWATGIIALAGIASIGGMATVNFLIDSDFKWPLAAVAALWGLAVALSWRGH